MTKIGVQFILIAVSLASAAVAQPQLVGTYCLVSMTEKVVATGEIKNYGVHPVGYISYSADGRMMTIIGDADRPSSDPGTLDDATRAKLYNSMAAYAGTYSFDGKMVTHHIDIATRQTMTGTSVIRYVEKRGDTLIYRAPAAPLPRDGEVVSIEAVWKKVPTGDLDPCGRK
jgi:hypothetical protein